jgi:hypothetical protein
MCWWPNLARLEKSDAPVFYSGWSDFDCFRTWTWRELNLKIKDVLRPVKILKGDMEPLEKDSKPKAEVTKTGMCGFGKRSVRVFQIK